MDPLASGHNAANATLIRTQFRRAEIGTVEAVAHSSIEDRAARFIAELFEHDKDDVCGMHDTDKIGKRAIGDLTRKKNGRVIDPFPEGQALVKKVHEQVATALMRARVRALAGGRRAHAHTGITTLVRAHATIMQRPPPWPLTL